MPMYEYECPACGKFEVQQRITAEPLTECGTCGKPVRRLISTTSFALKGGGWYGDGYGSSGGKSGKSESAPAASATPDTKAAGGCGAGACGTGACASALPN